MTSVSDRDINMSSLVPEARFFLAHLYFPHTEFQSQCGPAHGPVYMKYLERSKQVLVVVSWARGLKGN